MKPYVIGSAPPRPKTSSTVGPEPYQVFVRVLKSLVPELDLHVRFARNQEDVRITTGGKNHSVVDMTVLLRRHDVYLMWINVTSRLRRTGIAKRIVDALHEAGRQAGYLEFTFEVGTNDSAHGFWTRYLGRPVAIAEHVVTPLYRIPGER